MNTTTGYRYIYPCQVPKASWVGGPPPVGLAMQWCYCGAMAASVDVTTCLFGLSRRLLSKDGVRLDLHSYGVTCIRTIMEVKPKMHSIVLVFMFMFL